MRVLMSLRGVSSPMMQRSPSWMVGCMESPCAVMAALPLMPGTCMWSSACSGLSSCSMMPHEARQSSKYGMSSWRLKCMVCGCVLSMGAGVWLGLRPMSHSRLTCGKASSMASRPLAVMLPRCIHVAMLLRGTPMSWAKMRWLPLANWSTRAVSFSLSFMLFWFFVGWVCFFCCFAWVIVGKCVPLRCV